jgi:hypothetical protein
VTFSLPHLFLGEEEQRPDSMPRCCFNFTENLSFSVSENDSRFDTFEDLAWLAQMVAEQHLRTSIEVEASWHDIGEVAQRLLQRQFTGKAVAPDIEEKLSLVEVAD